MILLLSKFTICDAVIVLHILSFSLMLILTAVLLW